MIEAGQRFGSLTVTSERVPHARKTSGKIEYKYVCKCDCGGSVNVLSGNLRKGFVRSCGCLKRAGNNIRHGSARSKGRTPEYVAWTALKNRCNNTNYKFYHRYGGRGITVCPEWMGRGGFELFLQEIGLRPAKGMSVDRIDNDRGYEPGNVRWASAREQRINQSKRGF